MCMGSHSHPGSLVIAAALPPSPLNAARPGGCRLGGLLPAAHALSQREASFKAPLAQAISVMRVMLPVKMELAEPEAGNPEAAACLSLVEAIANTLFEAAAGLSLVL